MYVQIVKFRLKPDASRDSFLILTEQMIAWLKSRPGFIAYELYEGDECWSDRISWENQASAQNGLKDFQSTVLAMKIIPLIADGHSSFFGHVAASSQ